MLEKGQMDNRIFWLTEYFDKLDMLLLSGFCANIVMVFWGFKNVAKCLLLFYPLYYQTTIGEGSDNYIQHFNWSLGNLKYAVNFDSHYFYGAT